MAGMLVNGRITFGIVAALVPLCGWVLLTVVDLRSHVAMLRETEDPCVAEMAEFRKRLATVEGKTTIIQGNRFKRSDGDALLNKVHLLAQRLTGTERDIGHLRDVLSSMSQGP